MFRPLFLLMSLALSASPGLAAGPGSVVLLHGLARSATSMQPMARQLEQAGFRVCNIDYPSRHHAIEVLAAEHVLPQISACQMRHPGPVHLVTHSLGGIIARHLAATRALEAIGRVVMLGPPNAGSEVVDRIGSWRLFQALNGPAGRQLGTGSSSLPRQLGPADFEVGVIAGRRTVNPLLSLMIPGPDDGKVSVASARLEGMRDFIVLPVTHPLMMRSRLVIRHTIHFLRHGRFVASSG